jgi:anti-sigma factor RsiW
VSCQEAQDLLHGYLDGELDLVRTLDIERHLRDCSSCARIHAQQQALRSALRDGALYFTPPEPLESRILAAVQRISNAHARTRGWSWRWLSLGAAVACMAIVLWSVMPLSIEFSAPDHALQELVAGHVRSLMVDHLTDVTSSDSHTVKPWFEGKLDFSPPVPELTMQDFRLVGGRLEYFGERPVAVLVYQRRDHVINLFMWPAQPQTGGNATMVTRQGYQLAHWQMSGLSYWAVSNLNPAELQEYVRAVRQQTAALPSSPTRR